MRKLKIGWSEVDITPKKGVKIGLSGQFFERVTDEVESPITVTALVIDNSEDYIINCACDLLEIGDNLNALVKEKIAKETDINPDKIILSAIHTHTSYEYKEISEISPNSSHFFDYIKNLMPSDVKYEELSTSSEKLDPEIALNFLVQKIFLAITTAWKNKDYGYIRNAFGRVAVGMCRRVCYKNGSALMWGDTNDENFEELESGNDNGLELIYTYDKDKKLTGVIANVACPSQVVEHRSFISSDYWGKVKENLRKEFGSGFFVLGLCSAAGDQCPRDMIRWVEPEIYIDDPNIKRKDVVERRADPSMFDISGLKKVGKRISNEILSVYEDLDSEFIGETEIKHKTINLKLPLRTVTNEEYQNAVNVINAFFEQNRGKTINFDDNASIYVHIGTVARYELQKTVKEFNNEIHIVKLGDVAIVTNPYELFLNYGNRIRARSRAKQTFIIQLACGCKGYLPTAKAEKGSHYSAYVTSGYTGKFGGEILTEETIKNINELF